MCYRNSNCHFELTLTSHHANTSTRSHEIKITGMLIGRHENTNSRTKHSSRKKNGIAQKFDKHDFTDRNTVARLGI